MKPRRLVVVSNRVGPIKGADLAGGLAVAVVGALHRRGGLWFGWSGTTVDSAPQKHTEKHGAIETVTLDLVKKDYDAYYGGYANGCLWPICHFRVDLVEYRREDWNAYMRVNETFAKELVPLLRADDVVWVHDFHLFPLGRMLRDRGVKNPIGFFLHTPVPPLALLKVLPEHEMLLEGMRAYDLVGLQTEPDRLQLAEAMATLPPGRDRRFRGAAYPVGIDARTFRTLATSSRGQKDYENACAELRGRSQIIGVDRLDYSKGLLRRMIAFDSMLEAYPQHHRRVEYLQIAPISRGELRAYKSFRSELDQAAARINGRFADVDWTPVRYLNKTIQRRSLAGLYRASRVGLVTPMRDGMNLVAKEYVAAQDRENPGVLVLSQFAGAAQQMKAALQVNPYDSDAMATMMHQALVMPLDERLQRHRELQRGVEKDGVHEWAEAFLRDLQAAAGLKTVAEEVCEEGT